MDSAPKDGSPILAVRLNGSPVPIERELTVVRWRPTIDGGGFWELNVCGTYCESAEHAPTHWQPAPALWRFEV
jgi:hypothetical protein